MPKPPLARAFTPGLAAVSGYLCGVSGMTACIAIGCSIISAS
jgi:hypothetical protein